MTIAKAHSGARYRGKAEEVALAGTMKIWAGTAKAGTVDSRVTHISCRSLTLLFLQHCQLKMNIRFNQGSILTLSLCVSGKSFSGRNV